MTPPRERERPPSTLNDVGRMPETAVMASRRSTTDWAMPVTVASKFAAVRVVVAMGCPSLVAVGGSVGDDLAARGLPGADAAGEVDLVDDGLRRRAELRVSLGQPHHFGNLVA